MRALVLCVGLLQAACSWSSPADTRRGTETEPLIVRELPARGAPGALALPNHADSVKFAVIGDSGRGWRPQHEVAERMVEYRARFPFKFVLMAGDNIYEGRATPDDYRIKFEEPYRTLLDTGVKFFAVLGNHDDPDQRFYPPFNMNGKRYYTFRPPANLLARLTDDVQVFALDSTNFDADQRAWAERELSKSKARWKIVLMHHPLYSPGRYQTQSWRARRRVEPLFVQGGVDVVFSGHEHLYARMTLQHGVQYVISGAAGSLRKGDAQARTYVARSFDDDFHFVLAEVDGDKLYLQAISRGGRTIDAAVLEETPALSARDMQDRRRSPEPSARTSPPIR
jgi:DNA repair exonuclease SbcCD nuclease subunit